MALLTVIFSICLLWLVVAVKGQSSIVQIPVTISQGMGPCCAECPRGLQDCVDQYLQGNRTEPCTLSLCKFTITDVTDGDSDTGLDLNDEGIVSIELELGSLYTLDEVRIERVNSVPNVTTTSFSLYISQDGEEFVLVSESSSLLPSGQEIFNLRNGERTVSYLAAHIQLRLNSSSDSALSVVTEITVFGEEAGCGVCVDQLLDSLANITTLINRGFDLLPISSSLEILRAEIGDVQTNVAHLEGTLLVLEVVLGGREELEENLILPLSVVRYDLLLTPSIPDKLNIIRALLNNISEISLGTEELAISLSVVESDVNQAVNRTREFEEQVSEFESTLNETANRINDELTSLFAALTEVTLIHTTVTSQNYTLVAAQIDSYRSLVSGALFESQSLRAQAEELSDMVMDVLERVEELESLLVAARDRAVETSVRAMEARNETRRTEGLISQINALLIEAEEVNSTIDRSLADIESILARGEALLMQATALTQSSQILFPTLSDLLSSLRQVLDEYIISLSPYRVPESCDPSSSPCTRGQMHADILGRNASFIVNSSESVYTLRYAREFLENIDFSGQLFNYTELNQTAIRTQEISQNATDQVTTVNTSALLSRSTLVLSAAQTLSDQSLSQLQRAQDVNSTVMANEGRVETLQLQLDDLQSLLPPIVNRTSDLFSQTGIRDEAIEILTAAREARNKTIDSNERVTRVEEGLVSVASNLTETAENVRVGEEALDSAESKFLSISTFLNATRMTGEAFMVNVSEYITENDRIIAEIDTLIAGLADIHSRINRINSPIQLESSLEEQSYISLQSPPGRSIDDNIQFETLDLYIWTGPGFISPALLFYAGPTYFEGEDDISDGESGAEDYFVLTLEDQDVVLRWQLGGTGGMASTPAFRQGHSQIFISRVGSQFQLRVGVSLNGLNDIVSMGNLANNSLLLRTSNRTSFFLGGWPEDAQLGVPGSVLPLSSLNPFQGQVQLLLFNGEQWGLWNVRGSSDTMFLGSFFRNELATQNTWRGPRDTLSSSAAISFDGTGFLWVEQMGDVTNFNAPRRSMTIISRPNSEEDGLVLFAYDPEISVSMEVAYQRGLLRLIIRDHERPALLVNFIQASSPSIVATSGRDGRQLVILFLNNIGFSINGGAQTFLDGSSQFFTDLTRVKVWYGGVREDMLESPFVPEITNSSYYGCTDLFVQDNFARNILRGDHYSQYYLNSPLQQGFSGTCLQSVYTRDIGLSGQVGAYLAYPYLELVPVTNSPTPITGGVSPGVVTLSTSFFPQESNGIILAAQSGDHRVYAVMRDGVVVVGVTGTTSGHVTQTGNEQIALGEWHYLLIELESGQLSFYVDSISQGFQPLSSPGLNFELSTSPSSGPRVLFVGGVDEGFVSEIDDLPPFTGCMSDFAYNFGAMSFLNPSMTSSQARYPLGVTYNSCPFLNVSIDPLLAVRPDPTQPIFCLASPPVDLVNTHGGFHTQTRLTTSNVIDLFQSSWELSMLLKQTLDGHVLTIATMQGHQISLAIDNGRPTLSLSNNDNSGISSGAGDQQGQTSMGMALESNVFVPISIQCSVMSNLLTCSLLVDSVVMGDPLETFYNGSVFFPQLPIVLGQTENTEGNVVDSFVGCISSLSTNGDPSGFANVRTDIPCYNNTESGLGFTGISLLATTLPRITEERTSVEITITFRPLQQNGLLLLLTTANESNALFTVGMYNGQLRVSNFNLSSPDDHLAFSSPSTVCNTTSSVFYSLSVIYNETFFTVSLGEEDRVRGAEILLATPSIGLIGLTPSLTVGGTPGGYSVEEGSGQFLFLLSEDVSADSLPPGLVGCVRSVRVEGVEVGVESADIAEQILVGLCPVEG